MGRIQFNCGRNLQSRGATRTGNPTAMEERGEAEPFVNRQYKLYCRRGVAVVTTMDKRWWLEWFKKQI